MEEAITEGLNLSFNDDVKEDTQEAEVKDLSLAALDSHEGWKQLRKHLEERRDNYRQMREVDTSQMKLEDIGQKFVVFNCVADEIDTILNKVDITVKEVQRREQEKAARPKSRK